MLDRASWDHRVFWGVAAIAVAVKFVLAALLPLTGDEAYFLQYARNPDWGGFYDHPGMVGWMLWLMEHVGSHPLVLRLPAILVGLVLAAGVYVFARVVDEPRARLVALLLLFTPVYLINVLITSDTGLLLFGFLSALVLHAALTRRQLSLFALAGVLLGLAFLSKYFAVLLGAAFLALWPWLDRHQRQGMLLLFLCVVPFGTWNIAWNYQNCWNHIMFNVYNRTGGGFAPAGLPVYLVTLLYLFALPLWYLVRDRRFLRMEIRRERLGFLALMGLVPLLLLLPLSLVATIGLHWVLLFLPLIYPLYVFLARDDLLRCLRFMIGFSLVHVLALIALLFMPVHFLEGRNLQRDAIFYLQPGAYAAALADFDADYHAMDSYSRAAVLSYYSDRQWRVFGTGSAHAREDDRQTDWRQLAGGDLVFVSRRHDIDADDLTPYFSEVEIHVVDIAGQPFDVAVGRNFDYQRYHREVLQAIRERYYDFPDFLPMGACPFTDRYFRSDGPRHDDVARGLAYNPASC